MIKANELRLSNLVLHKGKICSVLEIGEEWSRIDNDQLNTRNSEIEPIPLSEEWLVKFGWSEENKTRFIPPLGFSYFRDGFRLINSEEGTFSVFYNKIEYVHQLQNLYFALTGEELTEKK